MSRLIFLLPAILLLLSCNDRKKVVTVHPEGFYKEVYHVTDDSIMNGTYQKYYAEGQLADSCYYVDNKIHGTRKIYAKDGFLEIEETYENGVFNGPYKTYYPNGSVKKEQQYIENMIQGTVKQFYPDGKLKAAVEFKDNLENGSFTEYHENGNVHWQGKYLGGDYEQDTLKEFDKNGELIRILFCEQGICQTIWTPEKGTVELKKIFESR
jgi:antitoxin component YwqK of YwqJK toxin-antitoxin module